MGLLSGYTYFAHN